MTGSALNDHRESISGNLRLILVYKLPQNASDDSGGKRTVGMIGFKIKRT